MTTVRPSIDALGFVEVRGLPATISTADCMLKTADVRLLRQIGRDPAQISLVVEGALGACRAAVDAGRMHATSLNACVAAMVIGRPAGDTGDFVLRLAERGRLPFGERPLVRPQAREATPAGLERSRLLAEMARAPGSRTATVLANRMGVPVAEVGALLDILLGEGVVERVHGRYRLAQGKGKS